MLLLDTAVNSWAILVATAANMAIGFLWYSPALFGKLWVKLMGFTDKKLVDIKKQGISKSYAIMTAGALVSAFILAHFVNFAAAYTPMDGALVGLWMGLGTVVPAALRDVLFGGKPFQLYLINVGQVLVGMMVMGTILAVWI